MALLDANQVISLNPNTPEALNAVEPLTEAERTADRRDIKLGTGAYEDVLLKQYLGQAFCALLFPQALLLCS